jgi:AcrR family transcriptional regulator
MIKSGATVDWRESRRQSARAAIVVAAWALVHEEGLAALSLRDLARRAGITTPTVYAYFESKSAIYDAMFGQAAAGFEAHMAEPCETDDPPAVLLASARRFVEFCTADVARYQLLFQHAIPGFEPSPESYAPAVRALTGSRDRLALNGFTDPRHLDMWTALMTGLVDQQISNDLGGDRWIRLIDEFVTMFVNHCHSQRPQQGRRPARSRVKGAKR